MSLARPGLRIDLQEKERWRRTLKVTVPAELVEEERQKAAAKLAKRLKLPGFRAGLERLSHASFYYHFVASRLRLQLRTNDFSHWFQSLELPELAARADQIDIYTNTLDSARAELIGLVDREIFGLGNARLREAP